MASNDVYQIKIKTLIREFLDKETRLQIEIEDEQNQYERTILGPTASHLNDLEKGKIDEFTLETKKNLGKVNDLHIDSDYNSVRKCSS